MSTTYGTTVVPITTQQQRYDQNAVYFVKSTRKQRFGVMLADLTPELRAKHERNAGVLIRNVAEGSPAFAANVLPGDILIELNGTQIKNGKHAAELMGITFPKDGKCTILLKNSILI